MTTFKPKSARSYEAKRQATAGLLAGWAQELNYNQMAQALQRLGFRTRRGGRFSHQQVQRLAQRSTDRAR